MVKLDERQEMLLRNVTEADKARRTAKIEVQARIKALVEQELQAHTVDVDRAVRAAFEAGVPKTRIMKEGLHTTAPVTVRESLDRTEHLVATPLSEPETDPYAKVYSWDADASLLTIAPPADELAAMAKADDWVDVPDALTRATFRIDGHGRPQSTDPLFLPQYGNRHPAIVWAYRPENEAQAVAWLKEHHPEVMPAI